jgi:tRNA pseudouridine38-40 synthase
LNDEPRSVRLRIDLAYDGSGFSGWAAQPGRRTVEDVVAVALGRVLRLPGPPGLTVAGRTDAGVHARGQVVHVDVPAADWPAATGGQAGRAATGGQAGRAATGGQVSSAAAGGQASPAAGQVSSAAAGGQDSTAVAVRGPLARLAAALPADVRVHAVAPAPDGFDARFSALWRRYSYRVCDEEARADPLRRHETLWSFRRLDLAAMNEAAPALLGEHDFAAFCRRRPGATTVRTLRVLDWRRDGEGLAVATVVADAFCHNMVRALVGALLAVGEGRRPPGWPAEVLAAAVRDPAVRVVAPHGLCLEEVGYPGPAELAARAAETRRVRVYPSASGC